MMKPNILLVTADQWRGDSLSAVGHPVVKTPHVDALAREGVLFARHYASAAPCSPARAGLYTGLYQMNHRVCRNGTPLDRRFDNLALAGRRAGYDPTLFGYTDTAPDPRGLDPADPHLTSYEGVLPGFTVRQLLPEHERPWLSWLRARGNTHAQNRDVHLPLGVPAGELSREPPPYASEETQSAFLAGELIRWMDEQEAPWFAHLSFLRPHPPFVVPEPYNRLYPPQPPEAFHRAKDRAAEMALHPFVAYDLQRQRQAHFVHGASGAVADWSAEDIALIRAIYHGMITETDAQLGRIFEALKQRRLWDNTIIIFTSDHAEMAWRPLVLWQGGLFRWQLSHSARHPRPPSPRGPWRAHRPLHLRRRYFPDAERSMGCGPA